MNEDTFVVILREALNSKQKLSCQSLIKINTSFREEDLEPDAIHEILCDRRGGDLRKCQTVILQTYHSFGICWHKVNKEIKVCRLFQLPNCQNCSNCQKKYLFFVPSKKLGEFVTLFYHFRLC